MINKIIHGAFRYGISLLVFNSTSHSFAALTSELRVENSKRNSTSTRAHVERFSVVKPKAKFGWS